MLEKGCVHVGQPSQGGGVRLPLSAGEKTAASKMPALPGLSESPHPARTIL